MGILQSAIDRLDLAISLLGDYPDTQAVKGTLLRIRGDLVALSQLADLKTTIGPARQHLRVVK